MTDVVSRRALSVSVAAHLALVVIVVAAARWISTPPPARVLPIEAVLVQSQGALRANSGSVVPRPDAMPAPAPTSPPVSKTPQTLKPQPVSKPPLAPRPQALPKPQPQISQPAPVADKPTPAVASPAIVPASPDPDKARREAELRAGLAAEEHAEALRASGAMTAWTQSIRGKVERAWLRPPSVSAALDCVVRVTQVPGGEVVSVQIQTCNGDASARESIEAAVYRASPLPQPADKALFERIIDFRFHPSE